MTDKNIYNNLFKIFIDREQEGVAGFVGDGRDID